MLNTYIGYDTNEAQIQGEVIQTNPSRFIK